MTFGASPKLHEMLGNSMIARLLATTALSSALVLTGPVTAAFAQEAGYDWSGLYVGFGATGVSTQSYVDVNVGGGTATTVNLPQLGAGFTVDGGYNYQAGHFVLGIEADGTLLAAPEVGANGAFKASGDLQDLLTLRGKLGIAADRMLFYATAGVGGGSASFNTDSGYGIFGGDPTGHASGFVYGPVAGLGVEYAANDKVSLKAEAKVYSLGTISDSGKYSFLTDYTGTYHPRGATLTVGANFHF